MARARKANATKSKNIILIYGEQFTGKSTLASQLADFKREDGKPFRVLYLDCEAGSIDDYVPEMTLRGVDPENLYIVYTQSLMEVLDYINKIKNNEDFYVLDDDGVETDEVVLDADGNPFRVDGLVIDGTTILNMTTKQGLIEFSKKRNKVKADNAKLIGEERLVKIEGSGLELKDYNTINFKGQNLVLELMASGVHVVITARETNEKTSVKTDDGKTTSVDTGRKQPDGFKGMGYNVKTVLRLFRDEDDTVCAVVEKDRTGVHKQGEIIEDPTLLDYQTVIDKNKNNKDFVIKNALNNAVDIEQDMYAKETLKSVGDNTNTTGTVSNAESRDADIVRKEIMSELKKITDPTKKKEIRTKLSENKLPTAFKQETNVEVLEKTLAFIKNNI